MPDQLVEFAFPLKGLHTTTSRAKQPPLTSPKLLNVMAFDGADRARGGQRPGTLKYVLHVGTSGAQFPADGSNQSVLALGNFNAPSGNMRANAIVTDRVPGPVFSASAPGPQFNGNQVQLVNGGGTSFTSTIVQGSVSASITITSRNPAPTLTAITNGTAFNNKTMYFGQNSNPSAFLDVFESWNHSYELFTPGTGCSNLQMQTFVNGSTNAAAFGIQMNSTTPNNSTLQQGPDVSGQYTFGGGNGIYQITTPATFSNFDLLFFVSDPFNEVPGGADTNGIAFGAYMDVRSDNIDQNISGAVGGPYTFTSGSLGTSENFLIAVCGGHAYWANGTSTTMTQFTESDTTPRKFFYSGSQTTMCCYQNGVYVTQGGNGNTGAGPAVLDLNTGAVDAFVTPLQYPGPLYPTLCATYRGRLLLANLQPPQSSLITPEPFNIYASAQAAPNIFNYTATSPDAAWAGNFNVAGQVGDPIQALIPFADDYLIIGTTGGMWRLTGDVTDGGAATELSRGVGMANPGAWCFDSDGNIYFVGTGGFFRLRRGFFWVENMSATSVNELFNSVLSQGYIITLQFDRDRHGIWIFLSSGTSGQSSMHLYYDLRTEGFFPVQFPNSFGPTASVVYNNQVLFGSWDGYVRTFAADATTDDGSRICSNAFIGPIRPEEIALQGKINGFDLVLGDDAPGSNTAAAFNVTVTVQSADDPFTALTSPVQAWTNSFTNTARQPTQAIRMAAVDFFFVLSGGTNTSNYWSYEQAVGRFSPAGRYRGPTA